MPDGEKPSQPEKMRLVAALELQARTLRATADNLEKMADELMGGNL